MPYRICLISLGCAKNQVNSEQMLYLLNQAGHEVVGEVDGCDVAIVNTCGFIDSAKSEAIDQILQLAEVKKAGGLKKILVTGCLSQRYEKDILESLPEVDGMLGTGSFGQICAAVEDVMHDGRPLYFGDKSGPIEEIGRVVTTGPGWAYLRIAEGCDNWCAFCAIPAIRGRYRSRPMEELLKEAQDLADSGVKELIVIAQDTSRYGIDLYGERKLAELLQKLCAIDGFVWVRVHYLYPDEMSEELIDVLANEPKIVKYLDIPIQHASDNVLKRMGRRTDQAELRAIIGKLREKIPDICLRTTLISGFPGETQEDFEELYRFVNEMEFDRLGVFPYSQEEDTPAATMEDQVPQEVKEFRRDELMELQQAIAFDKAEDMVGHILTVMIEGKVADEETYVARTYRDAPNVDGYLFVNTSANLMTGDFVKVLVTDSNEYDLIGEIYHE